MAKTEEQVVIKELNVKTATITIEGDSDLVLNKMNAANTRILLSDDRKAQTLWEAQHKNKWEDIITAIHWRDGIPCEDTNAECSEEMLYKMLKENAPCLTAFGLKRSWRDAVVQNKIAKGTNFDASVNIFSSGNLVPIAFSCWELDDKLMTPQRGSPIKTRINRFVGWSAEIPISFTDNVFSISEIVSFVNVAGFSHGIGSGRTSGYGRYHVVDVK